MLTVQSAVVLLLFAGGSKPDVLMDLPTDDFWPLTDGSHWRVEGPLCGATDFDPPPYAEAKFCGSPNPALADLEFEVPEECLYYKPLPEPLPPPFDGYLVPKYRELEPNCCGCGCCNCYREGIPAFLVDSFGIDPTPLHHPVTAAFLLKNVTAFFLAACLALGLLMECDIPLCATRTRARLAYKRARGEVWRRGDQSNLERQ